MLYGALIDRVGSGLWAATSVLYFTYVARLTVAEIGALAAVAGVAGIVGAPIGGRLADRLPLVQVLAATQFLRAGAAVGIIFSADHFLPLAICSALSSFGDRAANVLTRLYASRIAGSERVRYQAIQRTVANAGWGLGGLGAAVALAAGTTAVYRSLLLADGLSFLLIAFITLSCAEPGAPVTATGPQSASTGENASPWRDRGYLAYVATETAVYFHDAVFKLGLPLWAIHATRVPHEVVPLLLVVNNVLVVLLQVPLARFGATTTAARALLVPISLTAAAAGITMAAAATGGPVRAAVCLVAAAVAFTFVEILHATVSWELSIALAPREAQGAYLGVHGLAQATQRVAGPMAVTTAITAGPVGWCVFGLAMAGACLAQRRIVRRRTTREAVPPVPATVSGAGE